jgi:hypothetical protein
VTLETLESNSNLTITIAKEDRIALLALLDEWLKPENMKNRRMSKYINIELLKLPAADQCPQEWLDQAKATHYRSYSSAMAVLGTQNLDVAAMKKITEPYLFLAGSFYNDRDTVIGIIPQLQGQDPAISMFTDKVLTRDGEMSNKLIAGVGTAMVM